jgi:Spy/CpxP family protein refolding chaperone
MRRFFALALTGGMLLSAPSALSAQGRGGRGNGPPGERGQLAQEFRERLAAVMQKQLGLTDDQTKRMSEVNQKWDSRRRDLVRRDRANRMALRQQLLDNPSPDQDKVAQLVKESIQIERERVDLMEHEQADLAKFLTPVQRAKYLGIQDQMRRRVEQFRDRPGFANDSTGAARGRGRRPPPAP